MCARVILTVFSVSIIGCVAEGEMRLEQVWVCVVIVVRCHCGGGAGPARHVREV